MPHDDRDAASGCILGRQSHTLTLSYYLTAPKERISPKCLERSSDGLEKIDATSSSQAATARAVSHMMNVTMARPRTSRESSKKLLPEERDHAVVAYVRPHRVIVHAHEQDLVLGNELVVDGPRE
eukprot:Amastigsp_a844140_30.p1 type:complete len:125 gc:universal Amastigsp_a844140_30:543-169(-)